MIAGSGAKRGREHAQQSAKPHRPPGTSLASTGGTKRSAPSSADSLRREKAAPSMTLIRLASAHRSCNNLPFFSQVRLDRRILNRCRAVLVRGANDAGLIRVITPKTKVSRARDQNVAFHATIGVGLSRCVLQSVMTQLRFLRRDSGRITQSFERRRKSRFRRNVAGKRCLNRGKSITSARLCFRFRTRHVPRHREPADGYERRKQYAASNEDALGPRLFRGRLNRVAEAARRRGRQVRTAIRADLACRINRLFAFPAGVHRKAILAGTGAATARSRKGGFARRRTRRAQTHLNSFL